MYLVCDGGGTKTDFLLFDAAGRVYGRARGAGANATFLPPAQAAGTVAEGISACLAQAGAEAQTPEVALFIPGFKPALGLLRERFPRLTIRQQGDEKSAFYGALGTPWGIAVLAGTGGVANMGEVFCGRFRRRLEQALPQCVWSPARYPPVVGAALCVLHERAGADIRQKELLRELLQETGERHADG